MSHVHDQPRSGGIPMPLVLRANAAVAAVLAAVLLGATWKGLFVHLSKFRPVPWIYAQLAGAGFLAFAYLVWNAAGDATLRRIVSRGAAILNLVAFVCISVWLFSSDRGIPSSGSTGSWAFDVTAVALAVLGVLEARAFWRPA